MDLSPCFGADMNSSGLCPLVLKLITPIAQNIMLTFELSSCLLEIPDDAYTTLSQNLTDCSTLSQEYTAG